jgi:hypothetical protein
VPKVRNGAWVRNPIDAFITAGHEARGLTPAPEAPRRVLIRRLYLDLIGLPPSPEEVQAFINDPAPDAYENLVERLLASPHHGERWARHWLDVARWAESEGYESNHLRPYAWRYRDYVTRAFNQDKPFDRFILEQIAGDELTPYSDENLIATGFLAAARLSSNEEDKWRQRNDILVDITNATAGAFLGLTMNCAQCHSHKFDPITARDYYRFQGFFLKGQPANLALREMQCCSDYLARKPADYDKVYKLKWYLYEQGRQYRIEEATKKLSPQHRAALAVPSDRRTEEQEKLVREAHLDFQFGTAKIENGIAPLEHRWLYNEFKEKLARMDKELGDRPQTFGFYSPVTSPTPVEVLPMRGFYPLPYEPKELALARPYLLVRGDVNHRGPAVDVGWPEIFGPAPQNDIERRPRTVLARWLADPKNPLTARVYVNRLWHYHFGRGILATPSDFGRKGAPPTHPELLDWLADEFVRSRWSTRHMHRLIVTSSTYRQAADRLSRNAKLDPENKLWWHWQPRRLEAEAIRDTMLAVSGELDPAVGGPSVPADSKTPRRSLYLLQKRDRPPEIAQLFDGPSAVLESCPARYVSTVPLQSLYLLNNPFVLDRAKGLAQRVLHRSGTAQERQIEETFLLVLGRPPEESERQLARRFFQGQSSESADTGDGPPPALVRFCQALLNLDEFAYLE